LSDYVQQDWPVVTKLPHSRHARLQMKKGLISLQQLPL
jgi:hypothetical protein